MEASTAHQSHLHEEVGVLHIWDLVATGKWKIYSMWAFWFDSRSTYIVLLCIRMEESVQGFLIAL